MNAILSLGRWLFALPFGIFGLMHFTATDGMVGMVPIPGGAIWVYITGLALIAAAVSILIGKYDKLATTLLGVLMLIFVLSIHLRNLMGGDQMSMVSVLKDIALAGASFMYAKSLSRDNSVIG